MVLAFIFIYEIYHLFFVLSYSEKKNKKYMLSEMYNFPINIKTLLKGFISILFLYAVFMIFGFLGVLFLFYFLS